MKLWKNILFFGGKPKIGDCYPTHLHHWTADCNHDQFILRWCLNDPVIASRHGEPATTGILSLLWVNINSVVYIYINKDGNPFTKSTRHDEANVNTRKENQDHQNNNNEVKDQNAKRASSVTNQLLMKVH
jgi:hypothetical protein